MSSDQSKVQIDGSASSALSATGWGDMIIKHIPPDSTVLTLGSAAKELGRLLVTEHACTVDAIRPSTPAPNTASLKAGRPNASAPNATEPHASQIDAAQQLYRDVFVLDPETSELNDAITDRRYDVIVCAGILERLRDPGQLLSQLKTHLTAEGQLLIVVPNVAHIGVISELLGGDFYYRGHGILDPAHLRFFTRQSLLRMLDEGGFVAEILDITTLALGDSEFAQSEALADTLLAHVPITADHDVYEFIVGAKPRKKGQRRIKEQIHPNMAPHGPRGVTKVFWRMIDEEYAEDRSVAGTPDNASGLMKVRLEIPRSPSERFLGLRLLDRVGVLEVSDLTLTQNGTQIWHWEPESPEELFISEGRQQLIELHNTVTLRGSATHYFLLDPDSQAELNLRVPGGPHETHLDLAFRPLTIAQATEVIGEYLATVDQYAGAQVAKVRGLLNADRVTRELILKGRIKFVEDEKLHLREELVLR
ncbi:methyltransferase domain-containing protein, partial [Ferrimicrobium sp.]